MELALKNPELHEPLKNYIFQLADKLRGKQ
jgi:hypothetical protein